MRIWSLHPVYLYKAGIVALWRETLLAKHVLEGKTNPEFSFQKIKVTTGQMLYETNHLLNKLQKRDEQNYEKLKQHLNLEPHPLFEIVTGEVEICEKIM